MSKLLDVKPASFVSQLTCDRCGATAEHKDHEFHHFVSLTIDATWGSPLGDGNRCEVDLCHACVKGVLGPMLRVSHQEWAKPKDWSGFLSSGHRAELEVPADAHLAEKDQQASNPAVAQPAGRTQQKLGLLKGKLEVPDSFDEDALAQRHIDGSPTWNFRLVRRAVGDCSGDTFLSVHEAFYGEGGALSLTKLPVSVSGDSKDEVRQCLERMLACLEHPEIAHD